MFDERDGIKIGHSLLSINGTPVVLTGDRKATLDAPDYRDVFELINNENNFPINLKSGRPRITTNEYIILASTF